MTTSRSRTGSWKLAAGSSVVKPLLKWPGSKRRQLGELLEHFGPPLNGGSRFIEPFLGAGNVWLGAWSSGWKSAVLGDIEPKLMAFHQTVARDPVAVNALLHGEIPDTTRTSWRKHYYEVRQTFNDDWPDGDPALHTARLIWLNKTTTNGLWRLNKQGRFNASIGSYKTVNLPRLDHICAVSRSLDHAHLRCSSWEPLVALAGTNDLVYCDPPWPGTFAGYTPSGHVDHDALLQALAAAVERGARVLLDTSWSDELAATGAELGFQVRYCEAATSIGMGHGDAETGRKQLGRIWIHNGASP